MTTRTKWVKRSAASTTRDIGPLEVFAYVSGYWAINGGPHGQATDLASAQAAADAAVEELLNRADADFGLRFGRQSPDDDRRYAVAADGALYTLYSFPDGTAMWRFRSDAPAHGNGLTEAEAIAAARKHDQERRSTSAVEQRAETENVG